MDPITLGILASLALGAGSGLVKNKTAKKVLGIGSLATGLGTGVAGLAGLGGAAAGAGGAAVGAGATAAEAAPAAETALEGMRMSEAIPAGAEMSPFGSEAEMVAAGVIPPVERATSTDPTMSQLSGAGKALEMAGRFIPNKEAKKMLNLGAIASTAAANSKDPKALFSSMEGPMRELAAATEEPQDKRMSEAIPKPGAWPGAPTPYWPSNSAPGVPPKSVPLADIQKMWRPGYAG